MAGIAIIGGGVIGCAAAAWLAADGHEVMVYERRPEDRHASSGNAGLLAFPEITPLARPGVLKSVPRWLMDPLGPLALRWRELVSDVAESFRHGWLRMFRPGAHRKREHCGLWYERPVK